MLFDPYTSGTEDIPARIFREASAVRHAHLLPAILVCVFLIPAGVVSIVRPEIMWSLRHWWSVDGGEPSDFYLKSTRVGGVIAILIGLCALIWALLS